MRLKLITKFTIVTSSVLLIIMLLFAFINIDTLDETFLKDAIRDVDNLSETILKTTHYQMLEDDRKRVYQMIQEVGSQEGIEHIRLINKDGVISFSTDKAEIGTLVDKNAEACNMCHDEEATLTHASSMSRSRIFHDRSGKEVLGLAKGIYNQQSCSSASCHVHPGEAKLLGVIDVIVSLETARAQTAFYRNNIVLLTFFLIFLLALCLTLLTQQLVTNPVKNLLDHTRRVGKGNLDSRIEDAPKDELGELADAFNEMTRNLQLSRDQLRDWANTLEYKVERRTREIQEMQSRMVRSEKLASLGGLVAGIAHEINNPLTGILMYSSMIENDPRIDPALRDDLEIVTRETQRCARIVKGLLDFSRESPPEKRLCSVNAILETTMALVEHQAFFHNIRIQRKYAADLPRIEADPNQLEQVFMNMVINAGQAMDGEGVLTIETGLTPENNQLFIRIADTGCGIAEGDLKKIFDPFFTTKEHSGTGLGLSVSYGIIENHGGKIEVQSRPGEGTQFSVLLPRLTEKDGLVDIGQPPDQPQIEG